MRIAMVAPPFISIPPDNYGGTEMFVSTLVAELDKRGITVVLYTIGDSKIPVERRSLFPTGEWPVQSGYAQQLKELHHNAWAIRDAEGTCDLIHINNGPSVTLSQMTHVPLVCTIHTARVDFIHDHFLRNQSVNYVTVSEAQRREEEPLVTTPILHGIDLRSYSYVDSPGEYICFMGRICPEKGPHLAIEFAKQIGVPLKLAGEVQPMFSKYFDEKVAPHIDGEFIEFVGGLNLVQKQELFSDAAALIFPIDWEEPFGLVMVEAMACGVPVLALRRGSVPEIVKDGVSGFSEDTLQGLVDRWEPTLRLSRQGVRAYAEQHFTAERMAEEYEVFYRRVLADSDCIKD